MDANINIYSQINEIDMFRASPFSERPSEMSNKKSSRYARRAGHPDIQTDGLAGQADHHRASTCIERRNHQCSVDIRKRADSLTEGANVLTSASAALLGVYNRFVGKYIAEAETSGRLGSDDVAALPAGWESSTLYSLLLCAGHRQIRGRLDSYFSARAKVYIRV